MENSTVIRLNYITIKNLEQFRQELKEENKNALFSLGDKWFDDLTYIQIRFCHHF